MIDIVIYKVLKHADNVADASARLIDIVIYKVLKLVFSHCSFPFCLIDIVIYKVLKPAEGSEEGESA